MQLNELKLKFKDKNIFEQALTHKSWMNENSRKRESNERLEFLGDAILEFVVTDFLYRKFPDKSEGYLTALRANIVNTVNLSALARKLKIGPAIFLSKGEAESWKTNNSLLADTTEAIIGAIYLDQGLPAVNEFIAQELLSDINEKIKEPLKDPKSLLQEKMQAEGKPSPKYRLTKAIGPDHDREFTVEVQVAGKTLGTGIGKNKSEAQQKAASIALKKVLAG